MIPGKESLLWPRYVVANEYSCSACVNNVAAYTVSPLSLKTIDAAAIDAACSAAHSEAIFK